MQIQYQTGGAFQSFYNKRKVYEQEATNNKPHQKQKQNKPLMAGMALLGATLPVLAINLKKGRGADVINAFKNKASAGKKFKAIYNLYEMNKYTDLLASTTGGIAGGLIGGIIGDKNPENRKEKYKEGVFEFLNNMIPTTFVALGEAYSAKTGKLKSAPAKAAMIATSVAGGMFIANKTSNKINEKTFDKNEKNKEKRNFKIGDCFVHMDDILGLLVLAKIPFAKVIHADKILPLLYAKAGYEVASAKKKENELDKKA